MSLSIMGSVNTYTKTMKLQTQWNLKQQSGDYTSHKKSLDEWISTAQETLKKSRRGLYGNQDDDEEGNKKLNNIMQKIYAGKKLTQKERQYLQAKIRRPMKNYAPVNRSKRLLRKNYAFAAPRRKCSG